MNMHHLKYFVDAAQAGSLSRSAELNRVGHSAVSQAIRALEAQFEVELIYHAKRQFQLTPEGEACFQQGKAILQQLSEMRSGLLAQAETVQGSLAIHAPQSLVVESLFRTLSSYQKDYPKVQLTLVPGAAAVVKESLTKGEAQVGIVIDDGELTAFDSVLLRRGHFILIGKRKADDPSDKGVIVTNARKIEVKHLKRAFQRQHKEELAIQMEVMSWGLIKSLVSKGFGVGYVPDYCVDHEIKKGELLQLPFPGTPFQYQVRAIWPRSKKLHRNAQLFIDRLRSEL